ncbi:MAG: ABC transporter permease subunit [bacterium]|nr:ABC transporter permease subunit [bacterium]
MEKLWIIATEQLRQSVKSWLLVALAIVGLLLVIVFNSCWLTFFLVEKQAYKVSMEQLDNAEVELTEEEKEEYREEMKDAHDKNKGDIVTIARAFTFHTSAFWGVIIAIMLGMNALVGPLNNGRAAVILARSVRRWELVLGQITGATLSAAAVAFLLALVNWAIYCLTIGRFDGWLWIGMLFSIISYLLAVCFVSALSLFIPRVVAVIIGLVSYALSYAAANEEWVRGMLEQNLPAAELSQMEGFDIYTILVFLIEKGTDAFFIFTPPIATALIRAGEIITNMSFADVNWLGFVQIAVFVVVSVAASWLIIIRKDI